MNYNELIDTLAPHLGREGHINLAVPVNEFSELSDELHNRWGKDAYIEYNEVWTNEDGTEMYDCTVYFKIE